jgi:hypothetical protein
MAVKLRLQRFGSKKDRFTVSSPPTQESLVMGALLK